MSLMNASSVRRPFQSDRSWQPARPTSVIVSPETEKSVLDAEVGTAGDAPTSSRRCRVCFFFNAQIHQVMHAAPTAIALSRDPRFEVHIVAATDEHLALARDLASKTDAGPVGFEVFGKRLLAAAARIGRASIPPKLLTLACAARHLARFDAIVVPERTSLLLRRMGLSGATFIHTTHGVGDRAIGYERRIREFDLVLLAGDKQKRRMLEAGVIREGGYAVVGYPKFDAVELAAAARTAHLFAERRPTVLYNPHCSAALSSWKEVGESVLRQFAGDPRYNLIFAPHMKLFDGRPREAARLLDAYRNNPNIHIDLGSRRSVDMSYTATADIYLGDVSSQVYEFLNRPKPCLFLNAHGAIWENDPNYAHWRYGPVLRSADRLIDAVDQAAAGHAAYVDAQEHGLRDTFDHRGDRPSTRAARAIADFMMRPGSRPADKQAFATPTDPSK